MKKERSIWKLCKRKSITNRRLYLYIEVRMRPLKKHPIKGARGY